MASAERRGRRLVGVVLGGSNRGERAALMTNLLNAGFGLDDSARPKLDEIAVRIAPEQGPPPVTLKSAECSAVASDDGSTITARSRA